MQSYGKAVDALQHDESMAGAFNKLRESSARSWFVPRQLKQTWLDRWKEGVAHLPRSGRPSMTSTRPMLEAYIIDAVINIRAGGGSVNSLIVRAFFRGYCRPKEPDMLKKYKVNRR